MEQEKLSAEEPTKPTATRLFGLPETVEQLALDCAKLPALVEQIQKKRHTMCIPAQPDDYDLLLTRIAHTAAVVLATTPAAPDAGTAEREPLWGNQQAVGALAYGGYAPGSYFCKCHTCDKQFMGDKRAVTCPRCAYEPLLSQLQAATAARATAEAEAAGLREWIPVSQRLPEPGVPVLVAEHRSDCPLSIATYLPDEVDEDNEDKWEYDGSDYWGAPSFWKPLPPQPGVFLFFGHTPPQTPQQAPPRTSGSGEGEEGGENNA